MTTYLHGLVWVIEGIFFVFLAFATLYILVYAVAGVFYKHKTPDSVSKIRKFAVLIPGYKEDSVIVHVAQQATLQDYPKDKYEVIVIADSFQPQTLEALKKLPIRVVEVSFEVSKKSKALNQCMKVIGDDYDVAFVLDADNIMEADVLSKINEAFDKGYSAVQGHRTAKNQNSSFAILDAVSEEINNHIFRKGHRVLGISSALIGSGMGLNYKLFKETMATVDSVGEDKEVELKIIKKGFIIDYVHNALIYDEKTQRSDAFVNQRRRWIAAQLNYFQTHFVDGVRELLLRGNFDYFDKVIQMIQPPRILLSGVLFLIFLITGLIECIPINMLRTWIFPGFYAWLILFVGTALSIALSVPKRLYNKNTFKALLSLPYGFILMFISLLKFKGAMQKFLHTEHSHVHEDKKGEKS